MVVRCSERSCMYMMAAGVSGGEIDDRGELRASSIRALDFVEAGCGRCVCEKLSDAVRLCLCEQWSRLRFALAPRHGVVVASV